MLLLRQIGRRHDKYTCPTCTCALKHDNANLTTIWQKYGTDMRKMKNKHEKDVYVTTTRRKTHYAYDNQIWPTSQKRTTPSKHTTDEKERLATYNQHLIPRWEFAD